jgi:hypothetical protein
MKFEGKQMLAIDAALINTVGKWQCCLEDMISYGIARNLEEAISDDIIMLREMIRRISSRKEFSAEYDGTELEIVEAALETYLNLQKFSNDNRTKKGLIYRHSIMERIKEEFSITEQLICDIQKFLRPSVFFRRRKEY